MTIPSAIYMRIGDEVPASPETNQVLVYFDDLGIMYLEFDGQTAEVFTSVNIPYGTSAQDIAGTGSGGSVDSVSRSDHVHRGVLTVKKSDGTDIYGTITLSEGGGIALTQVGNNIAIQSTYTSTFIGLTDTPSSYTLTNVIYTSNGTPDAVIESGVRLTTGTNAFTLIRGTTDLYVTVDCNIDQNLSTLSSVTFAAAHIGGVANYTNFDTSGKQTMLGTARVTKSVHFSLWQSEGIEGTYNGVVIAIYAVMITYSDQWYLWELNENDNRGFYTTWRVSQEYESGTDIVIDIEWSPSTNNVGNIVFHAGFVRVVTGSVLPITDTGVFASSTVAAPGVAYQVVRTSLTITGTTLVAGDLVKLVVLRQGAAAGDTSTARVRAVGMTVRYTANKLGG